MENTRRQAPPPRPLRTIASIDTVEIFARWLPKGFRRQIECAVGKRVRIEPCLDRGGLVVGERVCANRPPAAVLPLLDALVKNRCYSACETRIDLAYDFEMETPEAADTLMAWIDHHIVLKWRSSMTGKMEYGGTIYWCDKARGRNIALYRKGDRVVRLELRFYRAQAVRRAGLDDLVKLPLINPKKVFEHNIKARRLTERYKINAMRKAVKEDRINTLKNPGSSNCIFNDQYRSKIGKRTYNILSRIDGQRLGIKGREDVSLGPAPVRGSALTLAIEDGLGTWGFDG